jgi:hypothetical protein
MAMPDARVGVAPHVLVGHAGDVLDQLRVTVGEHQVLFAQLVLALDLHVRARLLLDQRVRSRDFSAEALEILRVDRALVHDHAVRRQDEQGLARALVEVLLCIAHVADDSVRHPVTCTAVAPQRREREAVVPIRRVAPPQRVALGHQHQAHLQVRRVHERHGALAECVPVQRVSLIEQLAIERAVAAHHLALRGHAVPCLDHLHAPAAAHRRRRGHRNGAVPAEAADVLQFRVRARAEVPNVLVLLGHFIGIHRSRAKDVRACREQVASDVQIQPPPAVLVARILDVQAPREPIVQHVSPTLLARIDQFFAGIGRDPFLQPRQACGNLLLERGAALERQVVDVADVLEQLRLDLGADLIGLLARQDLVVEARALFGAQQPVHGGLDLVEHERRLPAGHELLRVFLRPLQAVVEVFVDGHLVAVDRLDIALIAIPRHEAAVPLARQSRIELALGLRLRGRRRRGHACLRCVRLSVGLADVVAHQTSAS